MNLNERFQNAETVLIGQVADIEPPPSSASGVVGVLRGVTYDVIGTLKGPGLGNRVKVDHYVVSETRDMQPSDTQDPSTPFRRGAVHMVFAVESEEVFGAPQTRLEELNNDDGIVELSDDIVSGLGQALGPRRNLFAVLRWLILGY